MCVRGKVRGKVRARECACEGMRVRGNACARKARARAHVRECACEGSACEGMCVRGKRMRGKCVRGNVRAREARARECACEGAFIYFLSPPSISFFLSGNFVDYERFVAGFFLLRTTFDSLDSYCNDAISNDKIGTARLNLKFNTSANPVLRMYVLSRYQVELLIDSNRQPIRDYSL